MKDDSNRSKIVIKDGEDLSLGKLLLGDYEDAVKNVIKADPELATFLDAWEAADSLTTRGKAGLDPAFAAIPGIPRVEDVQAKLSQVTQYDKEKSKLRMMKRLELHHENYNSRRLGPQGESRSHSIADWTHPIPIEKIAIETDFKNIKSKPTEEEILLIARSMTDEGIKIPITVAEGPNGTYFLRAGFRRVEAARRLGWTFIPATVLPLNTPLITERWTNIIENSARKPLHTYEIASAALIMKRDFQVDPKTFAMKAGYDPKYVTYLVRAIENLPPMIIDNWRSSNSMPVEWYFKWASMTHAEAIKSFMLECGQRFHRRKDPMTPADHPRQAKRGRLHMATDTGLRRMQRLRFALLSCTKLDDSARQAYLEIVDYCQGLRDTVLDIYDYKARHRTTKGRRGKRSGEPGTGDALDMEEEMEKMVAEVCTGEDNGEPIVSDVLPIRPIHPTRK
jgi:ParB/RepB/Spo0J family partition protein